MEKRSNFSGRIGFVLAAAGSAVGLGNIWRFPYLAAQYGGGIFLLVYILLVVSFGFTLMMCETALGRKTGKSAIEAFKSLNKKYAFIGVIASIVPIIIFPYYSVITGWVMKYVSVYITGAAHEAAGDTFFSNFIASPAEPLVWFLIVIAVCFVVVLLGVEKGIEKVAKFLMPILVLLSIVVAIYSITLPGAMDGVIYFIKPDFSSFSVKTILAALGQMFYSMSLAMGIMITYGSYMRKEDDLEKSVHQIEFFDTGISILAGLMIIPAVFAFSNGDMSKLNQGPGLMFVTLPKVFDSMGQGTVWGSIMGVLFFVLVLFAALTSAISLMETIVSIVRDKFHLSRPKACVVVAILAILLGVPSSLGNGIWGNFKIFGFNFLDFMDFISNSVIMPIVALLTCLFVAYVIGMKSIAEEVKLTNGKFKSEKVVTVIAKYVAPICILAILISSVLNSLHIITI